MTTILNNVKAYFSTILGIILISLSIVSAYFDYPKDHSIFIDLIVGCIGFVLIFTKPEKIASELLEILKAKFSGNNSKT